MRRFRTSAMWRLAGLATAYALLIQTFFAYAVISQAAAANPGASLGDHFIICFSTANADAGSTDGAPAKSSVHCPSCTLAHAAADVPPSPAALPLPRRVAGAVNDFIDDRACVASHRARAGLSRAPPQHA